MKTKVRRWCGGVVVLWYGVVVWRVWCGVWCGGVVVVWYGTIGTYIYRTIGTVWFSFDVVVVVVVGGGGGDRKSRTGNQRFAEK